MPNVNNPAGRLQRVLQRVAAVDKDRGNQQAQQIWAQILALKHDDHSGLFRRLAIIIDLVKEAVTAVKSLDNIKIELYLAWEPNVKTAFDELNLRDRFANFARHIDGQTLAMLEICDDLIARSTPEGNPNEDELRKLRSEVFNLIGEVKQSKIDPRLREYMLHHLYLLDQAIGDYEYGGAKTLRIALESSLGAVLINRPLYEQAKDSTFGNKFMRVLATYVLILGAVQGTEQLAESVARFLPEYGEEEDEAAALITIIRDANAAEKAEVAAESGD